jgi:RNA polymerase sigma-70 factor (ECF subfamily)
MMGCHRSLFFATYLVMASDHEADRSRQAFEDLYERLARRLLVHLVRRMHDVDAATELWAECWAIAFAGWSRCKARSEGEVEAWVFGIARNQLGSYYRSGRVATRTVEELSWTVPAVLESDRAEIEIAADLSELQTVLRQELERLPAKRRQAVELRILSELPYPQIAARLDCSEQAARAHVSRGLKQLERQLDRKQIFDLQGATQ